MFEGTFKKVLWYGFAGFFVIVPFLFYPLINWFPVPIKLIGIDAFGTELFELPKIYFFYLYTAGTLLCIGVRCLHAPKKQITEVKASFVNLGFTFVLVMWCSSIFSIDLYSSIVGYPTRLIGGMISIMTTVGFILTYKIADFSKAEQRGHVILIWMSGLLVACYGIFQRWGIDKSVWEQDVQSRVFSTIGQPNWLAAYLVGIWFLGGWLWTYTRTKSDRFLLVLGNAIIFASIIFTASRSGLIGMGLGVFVFLVWYLRKQKERIKYALIGLCIIGLGLGLFYRQGVGAQETTQIRALVWQGAWKVWQNYPFLGSGPETFSFAFYQHRPVGLLHTSEWDFLYNKAHNEPLHYLATTGIVGFLAYLILMLGVSYSLFVTGCNRSIDHSSQLRAIMLCGVWVATWVTNWFGFSTIMTLLTCIMCLIFYEQERQVGGYRLLIDRRYAALIAFFGIVLMGFSLLSLTSEYYLGQAKKAQQAGQVFWVLRNQNLALHYTPWNYWIKVDLAYTYAFIARVSEERRESNQSASSGQEAMELLEASLQASPRNPIVWRKAAAGYAELAKIDASKVQARLIEIMQQLEKMAPTDVKILQGLVNYYELINEQDSADRLSQKLAALRSDWRDEKKE